MAEYDRDRTDEAEDLVRERNIVRDGGIARSDADIEDVTRDTYGTSIGQGSDGDHDAADEDRTQAREVLGISRDVTPDSDFAAGGSDSGRRRRSDDLDEGGLGQDPSGAPYDGPDGLKVRD